MLNKLPLFTNSPKGTETNFSAEHMSGKTVLGDLALRSIYTINYGGIIKIRLDHRNQKMT